MKLELTHPNYCATVALIESISPIPGADRIVLARVMGSNVIVGKESTVGTAGLFFPAGTALAPGFASVNNIYRKPELNKSPQARPGMFEQDGRVKAIKLKGVISEGFFMPFLVWLDDNLAIANLSDELRAGVSFNEIEGICVCKKYIPKSSVNDNRCYSGEKKKSKAIDSIVEGQFRFHSDTSQLARYDQAIKPDTIISITKKYHGTSAVVGNLLVYRKLSLLEKIAKLFGARVQEDEYQIVWASRRVVKGVSESLQDKIHFYGEDVWKIWADKLSKQIPAGITLYGEIIGFTPGGKAIQPGYSYYQRPGESEFMVYRITNTSPDGFVTEFTHPQIQAFCFARNILCVECIYYGEAWGYAWGSIGEGPDPEFVGKEIDAKLKELAAQGNDPSNPGMPQEGFVVAVEREGDREFYKSKNPAFLVYESKQADTGQVDMETAEEIESIEDTNETLPQQ